MVFQVPNQFRKRTGILSSNDSYGNMGAFEVPYTTISGKRVLLVCISSDGLNWEHVSVCKIHRKKRFIPSWNEMCFVKNLFWSTEDCVMQLHPPESDYVDNNPYVLHLWKPKNTIIPMPLKEMV